MLYISSTPPVAHLGWDLQFTRIARYAGPRILQVLHRLTQPCLERGHSVRIQHRLEDDNVSSLLSVLDPGGDVGCTLRFWLSDGWVLSHRTGAHLDVELQLGKNKRQVLLPLRRRSARFSTDPGEVYYNAGDAVDVACLQGPLLACL